MENTTENLPVSINNGTENTVNQTNPESNTQENTQPKWDSDDNPYKKDALTYKGKFEHAKKKLKELSLDESQQPTNDTAKTVNNPSPIGDDRVDTMYQKIQHPELELAEINEINAIAKAKGVSFEEALNTPIVKNSLEFKKQQTTNNNASITSTRSPLSNGADINKLTEAEKKDIFAKALQGRR